MNMRGFLFSFICLWSCGCHLLAPRFMRALGGQIPAQTICSEGAPIPTHTSTGWCYLSLPSSSSHQGTQGKDLHPGCSEVLQASGRRRRTTMKTSHGPNRRGRGQDPILLADPSPQETKPNCILQKQKQVSSLKLLQSVLTDAKHMQSRHCNSAWPFESPKPGSGSYSSISWAKMFHFPSTPPLPWSQNKAKQRTSCREGWMDWWFGLFCVFAFKWEGIIGGGGSEKKQYWGGLVIFGAHLLEKCISLWISEIMSMFSRWYI